MALFGLLVRDHTPDRRVRSTIEAYFAQSPQGVGWRTRYAQLKALVPTSYVGIHPYGGPGAKVYWYIAGGIVAEADIGHHGVPPYIDEAWGHALNVAENASKEFGDRVWAHFTDAPKGTVTEARVAEARYLEEVKERET